ncbi:MAG: hypothetical protein ACR2PH_04690 [Desulfobulbia bacterium]
MSQDKEQESIQTSMHRWLLKYSDHNRAGFYYVEIFEDERGNIESIKFPHHILEHSSESGYRELCKDALEQIIESRFNDVKLKKITNEKVNKQ